MRGEVRFDPYTRVLYSTDGSNHQIEPVGVALPRDEDDLAAAVATAAEFGVPVLPRGAGTSLAGQAIGAALVLDCSKYMRRIHSIDPESMSAVVDPGVVCQVFNQAAAAHGLTFGPDPASADRATFGGMVGNNSTGAHSIRYGMTADHVLELDVVLADGSLATFGPMSEEAARQKAASDTLEGRIYRAALALRERYREAVAQDWPRTWRRASGYSLNYLVGYTPSRPPAWYLGDAPYPPHTEFNLAPLLVGSEGTLAVIRRARVRLVPRPKHTALVVIPFDSVADACDATPGLLEYEPSAVELVPWAMLERAASIPLYARKLTFVDGRPAALLVVEFDGETPEEVRAKAAPLAGRGRLLDTPEAQNDLWTVRKVGLGLLMSVPGDTKPITFIEDVAVPVERLGEYVRRIEQVLQEHGTYGEWYAHASAGCLHLRPMINLRTLEGVRAMRAIAEAVAEVVIDMGGSLSGEHGDGLSHTEFNERLFGPRLTQAFRELKAAFDPQGILNPGKVVPPADGPPPRVDENLRFGPDYRTVPVRTVFAYRREGDFAHAVEDCVGVGVCRKEDGVMCPSFQATREEMHLTRGRANALRAALSGRLPPEALTSEQMYQVLDLCLECKGCKAECPTAVDMARVKAEFLHLYQAEHGVPLRSRFFAGIRDFSRLAQKAAPLVNFVNRQAPTRWLLARTLGVARARTLPAFARQTFSSWFRARPAPAQGKPVVLFLDTFTEYNVPEIGQAAVRVLEAAGYRVELVRQQACCGRPMISKGLLERARAAAAQNLAALAPYAERGVPVVGLEPSCLLTLRDEYLEFFPDDPRAEALAENSFLIEEFLTRPDGEGRPVERLRFRPAQERILLHGHCHAKSLVGTAPTLEMLRATGAAVEEIPSGCCGMAGSFGYEAEHYDLSMQIGELRLFPAVRAAAREGARVVAHGVSCRSQIKDGTGVRAAHPVEVLAGLLAGGPGTEDG